MMNSGKVSFFGAIFCALGVVICIGSCSGESSAMMKPEQQQSTRSEGPIKEESSMVTTQSDEEAGASQTDLSGIKWTQLTSDGNAGQIAANKDHLFRIPIDNSSGIQVWNGGDWETISYPNLQMFTTYLDLYSIGKHGDVMKWAGMKNYWAPTGNVTPGKKVCGYAIVYYISNSNIGYMWNEPEPSPGWIESFQGVEMIYDFGGTAFLITTTGLVQVMDESISPTPITIGSGGGTLAGNQFGMLQLLPHGEAQAYKGEPGNWINKWETVGSDLKSLTYVPGPNIIIAINTVTQELVMYNRGDNKWMPLNTNADEVVAAGNVIYITIAGDIYKADYSF